MHGKSYKAGTLFSVFTSPPLDLFVFKLPEYIRESNTEKKEKRKKKDVREEEHVIDVKICTEKHASENHTNYTQGFRAVFFC